MTLASKMKKILHLSTSWLWIRGLGRGIPATTEHKSMPFRPAYHTVVDIGANRGQFALFAMAWLRPQSMVMFEPNPDCFRQLEWVSRRTNATLMHLALGDAGGPRTLHVTKKNDSSSLFEPTKLQKKLDPRSEVVDRISVESSELDSVLKPPREPTLLKIDVQGAEIDVLRGGAKFLTGNCDVLVETSRQEFYHGQGRHEEVDAFLKEQGFVQVKVAPSWRNKNADWIQADVFYRRPE